MRFLVVLLVLLGGCGVPDERAFEKMARATAAEVAHHVGAHLAGISPGFYGSAEFSLCVPSTVAPRRSSSADR